MNKFRFRLQRVLSAKEKKEEAESTKLSELRKKFETERQLRERIQIQRDDCLQKIRDSNHSKIDIVEMKLSYNFVNELDEKIIVQKKKLSRIVEEVEKQQERLLEASKEKKMLEKLREKRYSEYLQEVKSIEQKQLDEIAIRRSKRQAS